MIRNNFSYKLLAFCVAFTLWFYVNSERNPHSSKPIVVPVQVHNLPKGYTAELLGNQEVTVTVDGLKADVDPLTRDDVTAWVRLGDIKPGQSVVVQDLKINSRIANVQSDTVTKKITPKTVQVRLEALSWKRLPVEVKFLSAPPLGYAYSDPELTPASVGLSGRATAVSRVKRIILALSGEDNQNNQINSVFKVVPVDAFGSVVNGVNLDVDKVRLKLKLIEVPATKAVIISPSLAGSPKFPAKVVGVTVSPSSVTLEGKPSELMNLSTISTEQVSIDQVDQTVTKDVGLKLPSDVKVLGKTRVKVTVQISSAEQ